MVQDPGTLTATSSSCCPLASTTVVWKHDQQTHTHLAPKYKDFLRVAKLKYYSPLFIMNMQYMGCYVCVYVCERVRGCTCVQVVIYILIQ